MLFVKWLKHCGVYSGKNKESWKVLYTNDRKRIKWLSKTSKAKQDVRNTAVTRPDKSVTVVLSLLLSLLLSTRTYRFPSQHVGHCQTVDLINKKSQEWIPKSTQAFVGDCFFTRSSTQRIFHHKMLFHTLVHSAHIPSQKKIYKGTFTHRLHNPISIMVWKRSSKKCNGQQQEQKFMTEFTSRDVFEPDS